MKKKGFTLIELLAVIVILAIIALLAVPMVIKIINNAKKDAAKSSVLGYVDAIEYSYVSLLSSGEWDNIEKDLDGCYNVEQLSNIVTADGVMPSSDTKVCIDENSIVSYMEGSINNYNFKYENEKVIIEGEIIKTVGSIDAPTAKVLVYNGEVQELINEGSSTTGEIQYKLEDGTYSKDIPTGINVGTYKVYYRVIGDSTHYDIEEKSINVTINKANNVLSLSSSIGTVTYPDPITFEITNNKSNGTLSCESSDDDAATCSINGNTVTVTPGTKASNNVTITIKSEETDNYNKGQAVFVLVSQSGILSYTANNYSGTYDGEEHTISVTSSGSTIKYGTTSGTYNLTSAPTYTNAGTYTVYYQITKTGYVTVTGSKTVTINKALTATTGSCSSLTYDGSSRTLASGGSYVSYSNNTATNAGSYTVTVTSDANHLFSDGVVSKTLSCSIAKAASSVSCVSRTYTGSEQTIATSSGCTLSGQNQTNAGSYQVSCTGDANHNNSSNTCSIAKAKTATTGSCSSLTYNESSRTLASGGSYVSYSNNTATNAGSYTVTVTSDSNHLFSDGTASKTLTCSIAKAAGSVTAPTAKTLTYNGSAQSLINAGSSTTGTIQYKLEGGSYSTTIPTATNVGTYTVYYRVVGNSNYNDVAEKSLSVTINDTHKGIVYLDPTDLSRSCDASNSISTTGTTTGCMKWYIYDDSGDNYKMILDHNTTATFKASTGSNPYDQIWPIVGDYFRLWDDRLYIYIITTEEIAKITGNTAFNEASDSPKYFYFDSNSTTQVANSTNKSAYAWLYDYTKGCASYGCNIEDSSTYGYYVMYSGVAPAYALNSKGWTLMFWKVSGDGRLYLEPVGTSYMYGFRPSIIISKSLVN